MNDHERNVVDVLLKVSTRLAALHASRARRTDNHCARCGTFLLNGDGEIRVRRRRHPSSRVLQKKCRSCGHCQEVPIRDDPDQSRVPQPVVPVAAQKKRRKKTGLQNMLSRNREKEQGRLAEKAQQSGLAAFLTTLE